MDVLKKPSAWIFIISIVVSFYIGQTVEPVNVKERITLDVQQDKTGKNYYIYKEKPKYLESAVHIDEVVLNQDVKSAYAFEYKKVDGQFKKIFYQIKQNQHFGYWSLLPALVAIILCWIVKEPITSLLGGIISGALLLQKYNLTDDVLVQELGTANAAGILILYLWFLGGLMGIWSKTGAAKAFAELMTKKFVTGPKSAKLIAWLLGIIFFQGGTVSTVLVGTTVKPLADKENISHEELSYIVDSTASPIAALLAFNAWPGYVQAFIFVAGVPFLATESARVSFFFSSIPFSFYAIFAILGTFLLSIDKAFFLGNKMKNAIHRARSTGQLDEPGGVPQVREDQEALKIPAYYKPNVIDFFVPLILLISVAVITFIVTGSPEVRWAFGIALLSAIILAISKGLTLHDLMDGVGEGMKSVVIGSVVLLLAIVIGNISKQAGGGLYLVDLLGNSIPYWFLPILLQLLTMVIAFSTGTSWGTYAVTFPLAMPLAWIVATNSGLDNPKLYMSVCFATILNGSVYGDQCSPISDTTILSSMFTGCNLMDHVKTQIYPASIAAALAAVCWTLIVIVFA